MQNSHVIVTLPPKVIQSSQDTIYAQVGNSIYLIREQKSKAIYDGYDSIFAWPSITEDTIYRVLKTSDKEAFQALHIEDHLLLWEFTPKGLVPSYPLAKGEMIYISEIGGISALYHKTGTLTW